MERYNDEKIIDGKSLADLASAYSSMYPNYKENTHTIKRRERQQDNSRNNTTSNENNLFQEISRSFEQRQGIAKPSMGISMPLYHAPNTPNQTNTTRIEILLAEILSELRAFRRESNIQQPQPPTPPPQPRPFNRF